MIRCTRCLYPDTRPDSHFVDGVCSACRSYAERTAYDWRVRREELRATLAVARHKARGAYDVVVPVSGGKDSTFQVLHLKRLGARVLAVAAATDYQSALGRRNLDNLKRHVDLIEFTPNLDARKKLIRLGLGLVGDMSWPEHNLIWSVPMRTAAHRGIPLVVWGEQPQREYANPQGAPPPVNLNGQWVAEFGGQLGLRPADLIGQHYLTAEDLAPYSFPPDHVLNDAGVLGIWLGDYVDWDGWRNAFVAQQYGFETYPHPVEGALANYENLDNHVTALRDYLRFLKYGYGRATDIASSHIRRGRLDRATGLVLIERAEVFPQTSLGMPIEDVLAYCGLTLTEFKRECDRWTNWALFDSDRREDGVTPVLRTGYRA